MERPHRFEDYSSKIMADKTASCHSSSHWQAVVPTGDLTNHPRKEKGLG